VSRWLVIAVLVLGCKHEFDPVEAREVRSRAIAVGVRAPEAELQSASGTPVALSSLLRGNAKTVLVFYRGFF
jgi:hypothetical protein